MAIITWEESSASVNQYRVQYAERTISALSPEAYQHSWNTLYISGELTARLSDLKPNTEYEVEGKVLLSTVESGNSKPQNSKILSKFGLQVKNLLISI